MSYYFVEQYPERNQLIYFFHSSGDEATQPSYGGTLARYLGDGLIVTAGLGLAKIEAGSAWCKAESQKLEAAKLC